MAKYRKDIILIVLFLIMIMLCFAVYLVRNGSNRSDDPGYAYIYINGDLYQRLDLSEDTSLRVEAGGGYNIISVSSGFVSVEESDCKSHTCVKTGAICRNGSFIACIPHGLFIRIQKETSGGDVDAIAY